MHHHSHRHDDCCESSERCCPPPISWPQRPSFSGFPMFWPIPLPIPMIPSFGPWGGMRSSFEDYSRRRHDMYRYRCCERCGEYECRCERRCCERCGEYDCRCERRCERCGCIECRCGSYRGSRAVKLIVLPDDLKLNFAISIVPECLPSHVYPLVKPLRGEDHGETISTVSARSYQGAVEIVVTLAKPPKADRYLGFVYDHGHMDREIALLKLRIF